MSTLEEIKAYISMQPQTSNIYIGVDSERYKDKGKWVADYTIAIIIHHNGNNGGKIFGWVETDLDFDPKLNKPMMRMMNEVYHAADTYLKLADILEDRHCEIHLDIATNELHGSNCAMHQAIGYIKGVCGKTPKLKPDAFAASYAADRLKEFI